MRQNDGKLYKDIRKQHEDSCENDGQIHSLSVNTAGLWCVLDMAEQEFPVSFATDGEIIVDGKAAYEWYEKWFGTWAKTHPEFFPSVKRDCIHRIKREEDEGLSTWIECNKGLYMAEHDCCANCTDYSPVPNKPVT
jgi:hypothetical protein